MTIQEKFAEVKDHPLVVLLLKYYAKKTDNPIPPIWQAFIRDSTESTDLSLMYIQLEAWGLRHQDIPSDLFGPELLSHLLNLKFQPILTSIQSEMTKRKLGIIPAIEAVFRTLKIIPHGISSNNSSSKYNIKANLQYTYVETGTLKYQITRRVPANVLIPASFIRAFFGPEHSDLQVWRHFLTGMETRFKAPQDTHTMNQSLGWVLSLLNRESNPKISRNTGTFQPSSQAFPLKVSHSFSSAELRSTLTLSHPTPNPVSGATVEFNLPTEGPRDRITNLYLDFPEMSDADYAALTSDDFRTIDPSRSIFTRNLASYLDNPDSPDNQPVWTEFIRALRLAYEKVTEAETFQTQRKEALELAAGI